MNPITTKLETIIATAAQFQETVTADDKETLKAHAKTIKTLFDQIPASHPYPDKPNMVITMTMAIRSLSEQPKESISTLTRSIEKITEWARAELAKPPREPSGASTSSAAPREAPSRGPAKKWPTPGASALPRAAPKAPQKAAEPPEAAPEAAPLSFAEKQKLLAGTIGVRPSDPPKPKAAPAPRPLSPSEGASEAKPRVPSGPRPSGAPRPPGSIGPRPIGAPKPPAGAGMPLAPPRPPSAPGITPQPPRPPGVAGQAPRPPGPSGPRPTGAPRPPAEPGMPLTPPRPPGATGASASESRRPADPSRSSESLEPMASKEPSLTPPESPRSSPASTSSTAASDPPDGATAQGKGISTSSPLQFEDISEARATVIMLAKINCKLTSKEDLLKYFICLSSIYNYFQEASKVGGISLPEALIQNLTLLIASTIRELKTKHSLELGTTVDRASFGRMAEYESKAMTELQKTRRSSKGASSGPAGANEFILRTFWSSKTS
jgi:hypothetical protein